MFLPAELIKKTRNGQRLTSEELEFFVGQFVQGKIPDYQMAAWLMAVYFNGLSAEETVRLTEIMRDSGQKLKFDRKSGLAVDKHSTGGVGDKTSLILAPLVACAGLKVPMISGRGLGHTGGTVDKLESIPGFNPFVSEDLCYKMIDDLGVAMMAQTESICPADKKIYALRDVTGTVESLPLICSSIMSKKLAEGIHGLVLDVKFGTGAFMKSLDKAQQLAKELINIGRQAGLKMAGYLTNMNQPLGRFVGNSLEVQECLAIMKNSNLNQWTAKDFADTRELTLELAGAMIYLGEKASSPQEGYTIAQKLLASGVVYEKFERMCQWQGGDLSQLGFAKARRDIKSPVSGYVCGYNSEQVGLAAIFLGAGRKVSSDKIDPTAGIEVHKKIGDKVTQGEVLYTLHFNFDRALGEVESLLLKAIQTSDRPVEPCRLIEERLFA